MAALDRIIGSTIALLELVVGQVGFEVDASWHVPVLQLHAATPYDSVPAASAGTHASAFRSKSIQNQEVVRRVAESWSAREHNDVSGICVLSPSPRGCARPSQTR